MKLHALVTICRLVLSFSGVWSCDQPHFTTAYLFDDDTVITGAVEPQVLQDGSHLQQSQPVTGKGVKGRDVKTKTVVGVRCGFRENLCAFTSLSVRGTLFQRCL